MCTTDMLGLDYGCGKGPVITEQLKTKGFRVDLYDPFFIPTDRMKTNYTILFSVARFLNTFTNLMMN